MIMAKYIWTEKTGTSSPAHLADTRFACYTKTLGMKARHAKSTITNHQGEKSGTRGLKKKRVYSKSSKSPRSAPAGTVRFQLRSRMDATT